MTEDLLRVVDRLVPKKDGEPYTAMRTAEVLADNGDGTLDIELSGVTVPNVPVLAGAVAAVSDIVQVVTWKGALLILGKVSDGTPSGIPAGVFYPFAGTVLPAGYLWCDGAAVSRTTYADLFAVIGTSYGAGNGSTTFNVPNLGGRVPVGYTSGDSDFNANGKTGGAKTHTLTINQMPSHNHGGTTGGSGTLTTNNTTPNYRWYPNTGSGNHGAISAAGSSTQAPIPNGSHNHTIPSHSHSISSQGGGQAHNNMQPYVVARYIIKA